MEYVLVAKLLFFDDVFDNIYLHIFLAFKFAEYLSLLGNPLQLQLFLRNLFKFLVPLNLPDLLLHILLLLFDLRYLFPLFHDFIPKLLVVGLLSLEILDLSQSSL